jgi:hypothetical protein
VAECQGRESGLGRFRQIDLCNADDDAHKKTPSSTIARCGARVLIVLILARPAWQVAARVAVSAAARDETGCRAAPVRASSTLRAGECSPYFPLGLVDMLYGRLLTLACKHLSVSRRRGYAHAGPNESRA